MTQGGVEPNENRVSRCLWRHCRPLVTEINVAEYGSCCKQKEALVDPIAVAEKALNKLINGLHNPLHLFLSQEDENDVWDIGKHEFRSVLVHPMLSNGNLIMLLTSQISESHNTKRDAFLPTHLSRAEIRENKVTVLVL